MSPRPNAGLLDIEGLAEYLGITVGQIYSARHRGQMPPAFKVGRALRWRIEDVDEWVASRVEVDRASV